LKGCALAKRRRPYSGPHRRPRLAENDTPARACDFFVAQRASYESLWPAAFCREVSDDRDEIDPTTLRIVLCVTVGRLCIKGIAARGETRRAGLALLAFVCAIDVSGSIRVSI